MKKPSQTKANIYILELFIDHSKRMGNNLTLWNVEENSICLELEARFGIDITTERVDEVLHFLDTNFSEGMSVSACARFRHFFLGPTPEEARRAPKFLI